MSVQAQNEKLISRLKERLSSETFDHSLRVMDEAARLAQRFGLNTERAALAGLLHDLAKDRRPDDLVALALKMGIEVGDFERENPGLLHGPVGAGLAQSEFGIEDPEVLNAISHHTLAKVPMAPFDMLIYIADKIELGRDYDGVGRLRDRSAGDITDAFAAAYGQSLVYLIRMGKNIHPRSFEVWNWLHSLKREISSKDRA